MLGTAVLRSDGLAVGYREYLGQVKLCLSVLAAKSSLQRVGFGLVCVGNRGLGSYAGALEARELVKGRERRDRLEALRCPVW